MIAYLAQSALRGRTSSLLVIHLLSLFSLEKKYPLPEILCSFSGSFNESLTPTDLAGANDSSKPWSHCRLVSTPRAHKSAQDFSCAKTLTCVGYTCQPHLGTREFQRIRPNFLLTPLVSLSFICLPSLILILQGVSTIYPTSIAPPINQPLFMVLLCLLLTYILQLVWSIIAYVRVPLSARFPSAKQWVTDRHSL